MKLHLGKNQETWEKEYQKKLLDPEHLKNEVAKLRKQKKTIATLNGSFDLFHAGHLHIIYKASLQADILIVGLNSDESIKGYKSTMRPIIPLKYRLQMMSAIEFVDYVTFFKELNPIEMLKKIKPDVHVNGVEYGANCLESEIVQSFGGRMYIVDLIPSLSTSSILEKIKLCD